jgi:hypothetical protein
MCWELAAGNIIWLYDKPMNTYPYFVHRNIFAKEKLLLPLNFCKERHQYFLHAIDIGCTALSKEVWRQINVNTAG